MKTTIIALLLCLAATPFARAQTGAAAARVDQASPIVRLFSQAKQIALSETAQARLRPQLTRLLESSNFHSGPGDKYDVFTPAGVQQDYRDAVATGEYLLMVLSPAQKISTTGGEVTVSEMVVGLRGPHGRNAVFTIDESGTITSHAKYAGEVFLELKKTVEQSSR